MCKAMKNFHFNLNDRIHCPEEALDYVCLVFAHSGKYESKFEVHREEAFEGRLACVLKLLIASTRTRLSPLRFHHPDMKVQQAFAELPDSEKGRVATYAALGKNGQSHHSVRIQSLDPASSLLCNILLPVD